MAPDRTESDDRRSTRSQTIRLDSPAPDFEAQTTEGSLRLHDWKQNRWVLFFSHPFDFTPACTSEFVAFAERIDEFRDLDVALLGLSVDSVSSHLAWIDSIERTFDVEIPFPIVADRDQRISEQYGMTHRASSDTSAVRSAFVLDPDRRLRAMNYYPAEVGRKTDEFLRMIEALQTVDRRDVITPADWSPGDDVLLPPPQNRRDLRDRRDDPQVTIHEWYYAKRSLEE